MLALYDENLLRRRLQFVMCISDVLEVQNMLQHVVVCVNLCMALLMVFTLFMRLSCVAAATWQLT
jgi:hypothetical protein